MSSDYPIADRANSENSPEENILSAVLTPYRSLGPNGFLVLMVAVGVVSFVSGVFFLAIGAWPVFGFFGLDVFLIWLSFRLNYRAANQREEVHVTPHEVLIRKVDARGQSLELRYNPLWLKLDMREDPEEGVTAIRLRSHGEETPIGDFLNPQDRTSFAKALRQALITARRGVPTL